MRRDVKSSNNVTGSIRVISGQYKGRKLPVMDAQGLRPTTDRTKETLFNWLMADIRQSRCLDLFAGSGSLGIESLSRNANHVTFVELNKQAAAQISQNLATLKVDISQFDVLQQDALTALQRIEGPFDIVFLDPPFNKNMLPQVIETLDKQALLKSGTLVYIECERENAGFQLPQNWQSVKESQTKQLVYRLFEVE